MTVYLRLTACDHEKNGFVHLVSWPFGTNDLAKYAAQQIEAMDVDEARPEPDNIVNYEPIEMWPLKGADAPHLTPHNPNNL